MRCRKVWCNLTSQVERTLTIAHDGKVGEGQAGMASGYSVIKADSMAEAVKMAQGCPVLMGGAKIMVFETFNVM